MKAICKGCGKSFSLPPRNLSENGNWCSMKCRVDSGGFKVYKVVPHDFSAQTKLKELAKQRREQNGNGEM